MRKRIERLREKFKAQVWAFVQWWPFGYLCDFQFEWGKTGDTQRIRLTKRLWVIIGDKKKGGSTDALPITWVSPQLAERIRREVEKKWYAPRPERP